MLLSEEERRRFAAYLRRDAESNRLISEQLMKLGGPMSEIGRRKRLDAAAEDVVARMLEEAETATISG